MARVNPYSHGSEPVNNGQPSTTPNTNAMTSTCSKNISYEISPSQTIGLLLSMRSNHPPPPRTSGATTSVAMPA
jgi:hypothetical protein